MELMRGGLPPFHISSLALAGLAVVSSAVLVGLLLRYARRELLDHPSDRSSHVTPTPRGGGAGLLLAWLVLTGLFVVPTVCPAWPLLLALGGCVLVAVAGWIDDHGGLSVRVRASLQGLAGVALLPLALMPHHVPEGPGFLVAAWWIFCAIASANVVNFIDGIDGLIGLTVVVFGIFAGLAGIPGGVASATGWCLAGAAVGFLLWNWSPAKIFLGDVGSSALGIAIVVVGLLVMRETGRGIILTFLPLWPIVLDASVTLVRRWRRGDSLTVPHRSHFYQRLANGGWGHARVSVLYGLVSAVGAACSLLPPGSRRTLVAVAYLALSWAAAALLERRVLGAGMGER